MRAKPRIVKPWRLWFASKTTAAGTAGCLPAILAAGRRDTVFTTSFKASRFFVDEPANGWIEVTSRPTAAAVLVLADTLHREPVIIEPDDRQTLAVKEAAELLRTSSKKVYQMCLAGKLRCVRIGGRVRIPIDEIERFKAEAAPASTALVPRGPQ